MNHFKGQDIYVGIDVHKKSWQVSVYGEFNKFRTFTQPPSALVLNNYLRKTFPGASFYAAYEAGFCGFGAYRELNEYGIKTIVVNAADVPTTDKEKQQKTDIIDSNKIAKSLRAKQLRCIYVPSDESLQDRSVLHYRNKLVADQTRCKNRIKSFLHFHNIKIPIEYDNANWGKSFIDWLRNTSKQYWTLSLMIDKLLHIKQILKVVNKQLLEISRKERYHNRVSLLKTIPGIGNLSAIHILLELDDITRFSNTDQLASFVGITPSAHSSGEKDRMGNITYRGNKHLKKYLIEASWVAVRKDPELMLTFTNLSRRMIKTKAIIRIARKLLNRIKAVLDTEQPYEINFNL